MRLGLCCLFRQEAITFRTVTARTLGALPLDRQLARLSAICLENARSLQQCVAALRRLGIGAFRIMSPLFPRMTHPEVGYTLAELSDGDAIRQELALVRELARHQDIRLSFHPDQFVVLASPHPAVVAAAIRELVYQGDLAEAAGLTS